MSIATDIVANQTNTLGDQIRPASDAFDPSNYSNYIHIYLASGQQFIVLCFAMGEIYEHSTKRLSSRYQQTTATHRYNQL